MSGLMNIVVLSVHLLAVNLASAGPLLGVWLGRRADNNDPARAEVGKALAWLSVWAMLLGMATGAGQFYFASTPRLHAALDRFPDRVLWFVGVELVFSFVCLLLYAGCWNLLRRHRWWHATLALASSTNLFYHFPPLMSVLGKLANDPNWAKAVVLDRAALLPLMERGEVLALTTHFVLASVAVAAITVLWLTGKSNEGRWEQATQPVSRRAAWVALVATVLQLPAGGWLLVSLPNSARAAMMGSSVIASLAFIGALLLTFLLVQRLLGAAFGTARLRERRHACWLLAALVLLMTTTLCESRHAARQPKQADHDKKTAVAQIAPRLLGLNKLRGDSQ